MILLNMMATRRFFGLVLVASLGLLCACSDSSITAPDSSVDSDSSITVPDSSVDNGAGFADSEAVNERFGALTSRDLLPEVDEVTRSTVVAAINDFSIKLHNAIGSASPAQGSIESGFSAAIALSFASAATGGNTLSELATLLGLDALDESVVPPALNELSLQLENRSNDDLDLRTANRLFVRPGLELQNRFLDIATSDYGAPVTEADFAGSPEEVAEEVNAWVSDQTNGFIPTIIERFDTNTVFALLNAIFLDATWQDSFIEKSNQPFTKLDGTTVNVQGFGGRASLPRLVREDLTALEIPYAGGELAMLLLMPAELESFELSLNNEVLSGIIDTLEVLELEITVPAWQLASDLDLMELLAPLGLPESPWNFERLVMGGTSLDVIARQKARIEVDENGTRAAAVTVVAADESAPEFLAIDQPFVYVLRDRTTGVILFTGRVLEP